MISVYEHHKVLPTVKGEREYYRAVRGERVPRRPSSSSTPDTLKNIISVILSVYHHKLPHRHKSHAFPGVEPRFARSQGLALTLP